MLPRLIHLPQTTDSVPNTDTWRRFIGRRDVQYYDPTVLLTEWQSLYDRSAPYIKDHLLRWSVLLQKGGWALDPKCQARTTQGNLERQYLQEVACLLLFEPPLGWTMTACPTDWAGRDLVLAAVAACPAQYVGAVWQRLRLQHPALFAIIAPGAIVARGEPLSERTQEEQRIRQDICRYACLVYGPATERFPEQCLHGCPAGTDPDRTKKPPLGPMWKRKDCQCPWGRWPEEFT